MDLGTAATVFGDGLRRRQRKPGLLAVLALARTLLVGALHLPEPEPEYLHGWNFFWTLATIDFLSSLPPLKYREKRSFYLPYFFLLAAVVLKKDLASQYPGLATVPSYLTIHLGAGAYVTYVHQKRPLLGVVGAIAILGLVATLDIPISRATANLGYIVVAVAVSVLALELLGPFAAFWDTLPPTSVLSVLSHGNYLVYFLSANVLCGAYNLSLRTSSPMSWTQNNLPVSFALVLHSGLSYLLVLLWSWGRSRLHPPEEGRR